MMQKTLSCNILTIAKRFSDNCQKYTWQLSKHRKTIVER